MRGNSITRLYISSGASDSYANASIGRNTDFRDGLQRSVFVSREK